MVLVGEAGGGQGGETQSGSLRVSDLLTSRPLWHLPFGPDPHKTEWAY